MITRLNALQPSKPFKWSISDLIMALKLPKFRVAAVHAAPVFMDKAATIKKVICLIEQAAQEDVKLLVFPETFVPGYPVRLCFLQ
jgi:hypothetical protein